MKKTNTLFQQAKNNSLQVEEYLEIGTTTYDPCIVDFSWYEKIRIELLKKTIKGTEYVLDIGTGSGELLFKLKKSISKAIGINISSEEIDKANKYKKSRKIKNIRFIRQDASQLSFNKNTFDAILLLGDVLSYSNLFRKQDQIIKQAGVVLKPGGMVIFHGMNWDWEYRESPRWAFFQRSNNNEYTFNISQRTASGLDTIKEYEVKKSTSLHKWISNKNWPVSPQNFNTSLDVILRKQLPSKWVAFKGVKKYKYYTLKSIKSLFLKNGFTVEKAFAFGQTYDIANKAGLINKLASLNSRLSKAEAEIAYKFNSGNGPWLFLVARK